MKRKILSMILILALLFSVTACGGEDICQHRDTDDNNLCDHCGESYTDGKDIPDTPVCQHRDVDDNGKCDKCNEAYTDGKDILDCQHRDVDDNGKCDKCAEDYEDGMDNLICLHGDANKDHLCDYGCEILFGVCEDKDFDGACDYGCAKPYKACSQGLAFVSNGDGTCYVSGMGSCTDTDLIIPPVSPAGDKVTRIGDKAFYECIHLTSAVIPEGLERIEEDAFYCCIRLMSITIPASVTQIDSGAFGECYRLVEVINHSSLEISAGSSNYGYVACYAKEVHSGESKIDRQGDYFFYTYGGIHYLVGYVGEETSIVLPESYKGESYRINAYAFLLCYNLTDIEISSGVTHIGDYAFGMCLNLVSLTISSSVIDIGTYVTGEDYKLVEIINHSSLDIVAGAESFGEIAYYAKEVHTGDRKIDRQGDYLFYTHENTHYLLGYAGKDTELILPESYKGESYEIYAYAFFSFYLESTSFSKITSVTISDGVTAIGDSAFEYCTSLTSVVIGDSVTSIGDYAFRECLGLTNVVIGDSVTSIGNYAFYGCYKLVEVINHSSLEISAGSRDYGYVAYYAIEVHTGESKIDRVGDYLFYTYENVHYLFGYVGNDTELTLPDSYKGESYEIYKYAFYGRYDLTSVVIPNSVTSIGDDAFQYCRNLTSVVIGDSVTTIGENAFCDCDSLTSVVIPDSVTSIGNYAFCACDSLMSVVIGDGVETLGAYAFASCHQLSEITLGESLVSIGENAFGNCDSLTSVVIGDSVTTIGNYAFAYCDSLTSVVIPDSVTSIGNYAFEYCRSLTSIKYRGTQTQWKAISKGLDWNWSTGDYTITYNYVGE